MSGKKSLSRLIFVFIGLAFILSACSEDAYEGSGHIPSYDSLVGRPAQVGITAPATPASPFYTNTPATIDGTCTETPAHTVKISGASATKSAACGTGGIFSILLDDPVTESTYTLQVTQSKDTAGIDSLPVSLTWIYDKTVLAPVVTGPAGTSPGAPYQTSLVDVLTIAGSCETDASVTVKEGGTTLASGTCVSGTFSIDVNKTVNGIYTLDLTQTDLAGNVSTADTVYWSRTDGNPVTPTITAPTPNPYYSNAGPITLSGACTGTATHTVNLTNAQTTNVACSGDTYSFTLATPGAEGTYTYDVAQTEDATSLVSTKATFTWIYDKTVLAPEVTSPAGTTPASYHQTNSVDTLTVQGDCESGATVSIVETAPGTGTTTGSCSVGVFSIVLTRTVSSKYDFAITQTDLAGNLSTATNLYWNRTNNIPATTTITAPASNPYYSNTGPIDLTVDCTGATAHTVNLAGTQTGSQVCPAGNSVTFSLTVSPAVEGTNAYTVSQTEDSTGLISPNVTFNWVYDITVIPPAVTSPSASPHTTNGVSLLSLIGTCEVGATVTVKEGGATLGTAACTTGNFSHDITKTVNGIYTFSLTQTDLALNTSAATTFEWNRSTGAPNVPTVDLPTPNPHYSNAATLTLSGTCISTPAHTVFLGGAQSDSVACTGGNYSFTLTTPLGEGQQDYTVLQREDSTLLSSSTVPFTWHYDITKPVVAITSQASPYTSGDSSLVIGGSCDSSINVTLSGSDAQTVACTGGLFSFTTTQTMPGTYNYLVSQTDLAGNVSTPVGFQWNRLSPGVVVSVTSLTTSEAGTTATFTVVLLAAPNFDAVVSVTSLDTTEIVVDKALLTFTPGNWDVAQTVMVTGQPDALSDGNQLVTVQLQMSGTTADTTGYALLDPADVYVNNLDTGSPNITISPISGMITTEAGGTATFTVVLNKLPTGTVLVDLSSMDTTEVLVNGLSTDTLTFDAGTWSVAQTVTLTGVDDVAIDGSQTVTILTAVDAASTDGSGYTALNPPDLTVVNTDDDVASVTITPQTGLFTTEAGGTTSFQVVLNRIPDNDVVIDIASLDLTEVALVQSRITFTTANWNVPQTITAVGLDEAVFTADGDQTVTVTLTVHATDTLDGTGYKLLSLPPVTIVNIDQDVAGFSVIPATGLITSESGTSATFSVVLHTVPTGDVVVDLTLVDTTEISISSPVGGQLTFTAADWATPQTVTVTGTPDPTPAVDGNQNVVVYLDVNTVATADATYDALNPPDVVVTNMDTDQAGVTVSPTSGLITRESGLTASFTVRLNTIPVATKQVEILVISGDVGEVTVDKGSLIFTDADWSTPQTVTLTGVNDGIPDGNQNLVISLAIDSLNTSDPAYLSVTPPGVAVTNMDSTPQVTITPTSGLVTTENGGTDTFTVMLNTTPTADVLVDLVSGDTLEVTVDKAQLTFTSLDWTTPQLVTVTGVADGTVDTNKVVTITPTVNAGSAAEYTSVVPPTVSVTNQDVDTLQSVVVTPTSGLITTESAGTASFDVALGQAPAAGMSVVMDVASGNTAEVTVDVAKTTLTFTDADWSTAQTVTLTGINDTLADGDVGVIITLTIDKAATTDNAYDNVTPPSVSVTNLDNEAPAEGTSTVPLVLDAATLPTDGSVGSGSSYYLISGLTQGDSWNVSVTSVSADLILSVYESTAYPAASCSSNNYGDARPEACVATVTATGEFVIKVDIVGATGGATYTIDLTPVPAPEGFSGAPIDITAQLPKYLGGVDNTADSYYVVTGLTASTLYRVQLGNLTDNVDLDVFQDVNFTPAANCSAAASSIAETCEATSNGLGELYIQVTLAGGAIGTLAAFYVDVLIPLVDEGSSATPKNVTGMLPYTGMIQKGGAGSFYYITGLIPVAAYDVQLINMAGQGALWVFSDNTYVVGGASELCASDGAGNFPESCPVKANGSGILYILAGDGGGLSSAGATFDIVIK